MNVYQQTPQFCKLCNIRNAIVYPLCEDDGKQFFYGVCMECRDKVPYKVIPIEYKMDTGYFYCPNIPADFKPVEIDPKSFDAHRSILTKYGKKLLEQGAKYYGKVVIKNDNQNSTDGNVDGSEGRREGDLYGSA